MGGVFIWGNGWTKPAIQKDSIFQMIASITQRYSAKRATMKVNHDPSNYRSSQQGTA
jgi:hypothetical protein